MNMSGINFNRPALVAAKQAERQRTLRTTFGVVYMALLLVVSAYLAVQAVLLNHALAVARTTLNGVRGLEGSSPEVSKLDPTFLDLMKEVSKPDKLWTPKLGQLARLLPDNAWIVKVEAGTSNATLSDPKRRVLKINVSAAVRHEEEKILFPMRFVESLQKDARFSEGYSEIRFASTRILSGTQATVVNFDVECR
jgi:hypothetical protein